MRLVPAVLSILTASTLVATAAAQAPVTVRCTPTDGSAAGCYYCPGYQHVIKNVGTRLHSATINLLAYHDLDVVLHGTWDGAVIEVSMVQLVAESFSISGQGTIGHRFDYVTTGVDGDIALNFAALGTTFLVPFADLALQLDPLRMAPLDVGVIANGEYKSRLDIPNQPSLIGLRVFGQGAVLPQVGGLYTTNTDSKVVN